MGFGAAGAADTAVNVTLLTLGFICLVAGVVLPRIEGKFTAGPSGLSADMLAVHQIDRPTYVATGPVLADEQVRAQVEGDLAIGAETAPAGQQITLGDVWDALNAAGIGPQQSGAGHAYWRLPDGRTLQITNRGIYDHGIASDELLALLASWGVLPTASGKYPVPPYASETPEVPPFIHPRDNS
jgi:hypothetical protein